MKKIISALLLALCLCGCSAKSITPVIKADFTLNAVYKTGDFSYDCVIAKKDGVLSVSPTSTRASGMFITYDGKKVTFDRRSMTYSFDKTEIDPTNPALLLYEVFSSVESTDVNTVKMVENEFVYSGKTSVGDYVFVQNIDNSYKSIDIADADINITFVY